MVKNRVSADVRSLADSYFCEQCDRSGLPRPHPIPQAAQSAKTSLSSRARRTKSDRRAISTSWLTLGSEAATASSMWLNTRKPAPRMGLEAILRAYSDGE